MKGDLPASLTALVFVSVALGLISEFIKLRAVRQAGGLRGWWTPLGSSAETQRVRKALGNDPLGKRIDLFERLGTFAWLTAVAIIAFWQIHNFRST
jgi:hypothetical protein